MTAIIINNPGFYVTFALIQALGLIVVVRLIDHYDREPLTTVGLVAAWGATGAPVIALAANSAISQLLSPRTQAVFGAALAPPVVEEMAKGLALIGIAALTWWTSSRFGTAAFSGVTDGLLYGVAVGVGFAFTEDFFYFLNRARLEGLDSAFELFLARRDFFGPQALHHPLFTAPFGVAVGLATWSRTARWRIGLPVLGFLAAVLIHAVNNGLVEAILTLRYGIDATAIYLEGGPTSPQLAQTASTLIDVLRVVDYVYIGLAGLGILLWERYQRRVIFLELADEVESGMIRESDRDAVVRFVTRFATYWYLLRRRDFEGWRRLRDYHHSVAKLGLVKWRVRRFGRSRRHIRTLHQRLAATHALLSPPGNIPTRAPNLVGRRRDLDELTRLLQRGNVRLVTLTGPGGAGKSALAISVATRLADVVSGGAYYIRAATPADLIPAIARALGATEMPGRPLLNRLAFHAFRKPHLLVVDHEAPDDIGLDKALWQLLSASENVQIVAMSNAPLGLRGEVEHHVRPLSLVAPEQRQKQPAEADAVALFALRARAVHRDFVVDDGNRDTVEAICQRAGGLPLAIELMAATTGQRPLEETLAGLTQLLANATGGAPDTATPEQQVTAALDLVTGQLTTDEQRLLEQLSVFPDGCYLEGVAALDQDHPDSESDELEILATLVERNLVQQHEQIERQVRFEMVPTVREYVLGRMHPRAGALTALQRQVAEFYASLVERSEADLEQGRGRQWRARLEAEHENLIAALRWTEEAGEPDLTIRIAASLTSYWDCTLPSEGRRWLEPALASPALPATLRAKGCEAAGVLAALQTDLGPAAQRFEEAAAVSGDATDPVSTMRSLWGAGWVALLRGDYADGAAHFEASVKVARLLDDHAALANGLTGLGRALAEQGLTEPARLMLERSRRLRRLLGDDYGEADAAAHLGRLALIEGDRARAAQDLDHSVELAKLLGERLGAIDAPRMRAVIATLQSGDVFAISLEFGPRLLAGEALQTLAWLAIEQGQPHVALPLLRDRLEIASWLGDRLGLTEALEAIALANCLRAPEAGATLLGFVQQSRRELGAPSWQQDRARHDAAVESGRRRLGLERFQRAEQAGRELLVEQAVPLAVRHTRFTMAPRS